MNKIKCEYCGTEQELQERCSKCSAPMPKKDDILFKFSPFYYKGYMIWPEGTMFGEITFYHFWLGTQHIHTIKVTRQMIYEYVPEGQSINDFIFGLFSVSIGEREKLEIEKDAYPCPLLFTITRTEKWEKKYGS